MIYQLATPAPGVPGARIACMGNSIAANGNTPAGAPSGVFQSMSQYSFLHWAVALSGGYLTYAGSFSTGGQTSTFIVNTWLQDVIAAAPDICIIGPIATNNPGFGVSFAQCVTDVETAVKAMRAAGITPVLLIEPPNNTTATMSYVQQYSIWASRYGAINSIPVVDVYTGLAAAAGNGTWNSTYNLSGDGEHPNGLGAQVMGQAIVNALVPSGIRPVAAGLFRAQLSADTVPLLGNQLFLNSTAGVPALWTFIGSGATTAVAADGSSPSAPRSAALGNLFSVTRGGTDTTADVASFSLVPGHHIWFAAHIESENAQADNAEISLRLTNFTTDLYGYDGSGVDFPPGCVLSAETIVPAGMTSATLYSVVASGNATLRIGQITLIDLTAEGMTS